MEERAINAEKQVRDMQKFAEYEQKYKNINAEYNRLRIDHNDINRQLDAEKAKNYRLTAQLNNLNSTIDKLHNVINTIKMKLAAQNTKLFGKRLVKDLQQSIRDTESR